ncbi:shieldin complex subunit 3 [Engraulis encrasicolus]|uniref:shieldin complex subunit 3 n=1 Tax=Engraulis encrasicolus TaxID=184585 RepID=UPI002FD101E5
MDVVLHYRSSNGVDLGDMVVFTERAFEDFPRRVPPVFAPWFPSLNVGHLPIRPFKTPPIIRAEDIRALSTLEPQSAEPLPTCASIGNETRETSQENQHAGGRPTDDVCDTPRDSECDQKFRRSWTVFSSGVKLYKNTKTFSQAFQKVIEKHRLQIHQRVKWIIDQVNCESSHIESVWVKLTRAVRHSELPTCNANFQRRAAQIWIFCDVLYSEHVGNFVKTEFNLNGHIRLAVHKHGVIFTC